MPNNPSYASMRDEYWLRIHGELLKQTRENVDRIQLVFLGASIVERWQEAGRQLWNERYRTRGAYNYGISGDETQHVLWRLQNGELDKTNPRVVVMNVGSNNVAAGNTPAEIASGIQAILAHLKASFPSVKIILTCILPRYDVETPQIKNAITETNKLIAKMANDQDLFYLDLTPQFTPTLSGKDARHLYSWDGLHLSPAGYKAWFDAMEPLLARLLSS